MTPPLFDAHSVHRPARLAGWMLLALSAGAVNAIAFAACARFVTHVTGIVTRVGLDAMDLALVAEYSLVLAAFVLGAASSVALSDGRRWRGLPPRPWLPLGITAAILAGAALAGHAGLFGPFGGGPDGPAEFALLTVLAASMGLQNASVATATGMLVRTTHMTGPATDLGVAIGTLLHEVPGEVREAARRSALLRGGKILAFMGGALAGITLASALGYLAFLAPALGIAGVATTLVPSGLGAASRA